MGGERPSYGKNYIIPSTFDPRLISVIPVAVAKAAIKSGVARKKIEDFNLYSEQLKQRLDPSVTVLQGINSKIKKNQKTVVFAEVEDILKKASEQAALITKKSNNLLKEEIQRKQKQADLKIARHGTKEIRHCR